MDDRQNIPDPAAPEMSADPGSDTATNPDTSNRPIPPAEFVAAVLPPRETGFEERTVGAASEDVVSRRRSFRHNLFLLLGLTLAAFILTSWILVRVDSPFAFFSSGPEDIVSAQLRALDRGELRPAYEMFSPRYRGQVSFDTWHELFIRHWRMFHANVVRTESPSISGPGVTLEIYLRGADEKEYRARFSLVRSDGRWWIDDVHWTQVPDAGDVTRI